MATRDGAKALDWSDDIGSIEKGKRADLIALDLNQPDNAVPHLVLGSKSKGINGDAIASSIVYSTGRRHLRQTWIDGKLLFTGGKVRGIPSGQLVEEIRQAQAKIYRALSKQS